MKTRITIKDCTKENFERSLEVLTSAEMAYRAKDLELGRKWRDSNYDDSIYEEKEKVLKEYSDAITKARRNLVPYVGLNCSIKAYTDSYACVITKVITPNKVEVMHLKCDTIDFYGCRYEIHDEVNKRMPTEVYSRRRNGGWYTDGQRVKDYPCRLILNSTHHYIDPCF